VGNLGKIAEVMINKSSRPKYGNYLYGAFGRDFETIDGQRVMVVGLTKRQWTNLCEATGLTDAVAALAKQLDVNLDEEGNRFGARVEIELQPGEDLLAVAQHRPELALPGLRQGARGRGKGRR